MSNAEIARIFREMALLLEMKSIPFKPRAYENAAQVIATVPEALSAVAERGGTQALERIPRIGKSFAAKIAEALRTGRVAEHDALRQQLPVALDELSGIEGLGPRGIRSLYEHLGVRTAADLEAAARAGRVRTVPGFGERSEKKILEGLRFAQARGGRLRIDQVMPLARTIAARLRELPGVEQVSIAGSLRRRRETIGDMDFVVTAEDAGPVMSAFVAMPEVARIHGRGPTKSSVALSIGIDADLRVVPEQSFGAALVYFTGSKAHAIALRTLALEKKLKLNEYGVFRGERAIAGRTEEEVYEALGLPWITPELREDRGEIAAAREGMLPELIPYGALKGDLQTQTDWSDGKHSIEQMARAAKAAGLEYMAVTDHTRTLTIARGSDEAKLRRQMLEIDRLNRGMRGFRILKGAEVNILPDGTLDMPDEVLSDLDFVGIAVHSHLDAPRAEMTRRVVRAMQNPHAHVLFHPTNRRIHERPPSALDFDEIIRAALATGTALEIDAYPSRLDLNEEHARKAAEAGVALTIDSDAHSAEHFAALDQGVALARRAWIGSDQILNTLPLRGFLAVLARAKPVGRRGARPRRP